MDLERLVEAGKALGYSGMELREFVSEREKSEEFEKKEKQKEEREGRAHQLELRRNDQQILEMQLMLEKVKLEGGDTPRVKTCDPNTNKINARTPKLPAFNEGKDDLDSYLKRYERYAVSQGWSVEYWAINLSALLTGKSLEVYSRLSTEDADNYRTLKTALLKRFQLTADGFRNKLRLAKPETGESGHQFAARIENYLTRWIELAEATQSYDGLKDLLLREQFTDGCGRELALFLRERQPKTIGEMADIAEQYLEARGGMFGNIIAAKRLPTTTHRQVTQEPVPIINNPQVRSNPITCFLCHRVGHLARNCRATTAFKPNTGLTCFRCHRKGHLAKNCRQDVDKCAGLRNPYTGPPHEEPKSLILQQEQSNCTVNPNPFQTPENCGGMIINSNPHKLNSCCMDNKSSYVTLKCGNLLPIMSAAWKGSGPGSMPVSPGLVGQHKVTVLRDSGCSGVVIKQCYVSPDQFTGNVKTCVLIDGTVRRLPLATIQVNTPYFTGMTQALCMDNPIFDLILGNIEGVRSPDDPDKTWTGRNVPACAVTTRAQAITQSKPFKSLKTLEAVDQVITVENLRNAQNTDVTLRKAKELAENEGVRVSKSNATSHFFYKNNLLYRQFSSPSVEHGNIFTQLVVPKSLRHQVMRQAHESLLGGHQGAKKTTDKVLTNFHWPGITADITRYCRSCDICQRTVEKGRVAKVPLGNMPLIEAPFERIAVDIVGPIHPISKNRNRYILTIIDFATRYPEAIALPSIEAERVAEGLVKVFSRIGIPKEMLTDQGSQFTSEVMKQVCKLLSIKQMMTSPYHPACNGLVERFNGTLKQMLKRMCAERPSDWDRYIDPLLFAIRESPQESLGFSPFELLYGRNLRGPMTILRELWTGEVHTPETKTTYQYVLDLKERLNETCAVAQKNLQKAKGRYKKYYDKKSRAREFQVGDKVLLLLPTDRNKLLLQWKGPFPIIAKMGYLDYRIDLNGKLKTFHANLLKRYHERQDVSGAALAEFQSDVSQGALEVACTSVIESEDMVSDAPIALQMTNDNLLQLHPLQAKETIADVHISDDCDEMGRKEVKRLIANYRDVLTDLPGKTTLGNHDIKLRTDEPIRTKPYPLPHALRDTVKDEVSMMLNMGVIEPSCAPCASPIVLVKKPDGSNRFCVDFRKVNQSTVFDAEPIPDQDELFTKLATDNYFTKLDLSKGYWQVPMDERSKQLTSFVTPNGLFQFKVMPFGLVNAPATFSRIMRKLLHGMKNTINYIDDILIHTSSWEEHVTILKELFRRLRAANLTARPSKCFIGYESIEFLGHVVGKGHLKPRPEKIQSIVQAKRPETKKQLRSFLGTTNYYRRFIPHYSAIASPLTDRTKNQEPNKIRWEVSQENAFKTLKSKLTSKPILCLPDLSKPFILRTDACDEGIGAVLLQNYGNEKFPVAYASKKLLPREKAYSIMEKECLSIIWSVRKFETYLYGREFTLETDHQPLVYMQKAKLANGRIMRWALALQPYRFRIEAIKGSDNDSDNQNTCEYGIVTILELNETERKNLLLVRHTFELETLKKDVKEKKDGYRNNAWNVIYNGYWCVK
ncbi:uncharacterized protein [Antedon mediterranea]|uniref:uncharacterized protein n=1 Tax=Antedon mediterranea TaxID=105859 RepID=UPI003AF44D72